MKTFRRIVLWLVWNCPIPLGKLAPKMFAFGVGCKKFKLKKEGEKPASRFNSGRILGGMGNER